MYQKVAPRAVSAAASARGWSFSVSMSAVQAAMRCSGETAVSSLGAQIAALVLSLALSLLLFCACAAAAARPMAAKIAMPRRMTNPSNCESPVRVSDSLA